MSDKKNMKLFSLNSNPEIAQKIADHAEEVPAGKFHPRSILQMVKSKSILEERDVRGYDIYIIQSTSFPVNNHLMELLIMVDACQRASANTVNVVMPYFGYARQDRTALLLVEPITAKLVANMLVKAGVDRLSSHWISMQCGFKGFFDIAVDNLFTIPLLQGLPSINKGLTGH
ncbi:MAG: ribose-phosphate diphosphokinase [Streptococcus sp.]